MLDRLNAYQNKNTLISDKITINTLQYPLLVLCGYFFFASCLTHYFIHHYSLNHQIHSLSENILYLITFSCLSIGIPSSLLIDPIILTISPLTGVLKLAIITILVSLSQVYLLKITGLEKKLFSIPGTQSDLAPKKIAFYLLFRTLPILPFGVATLYLYYKLKSIKRLSIFTFVGSLIYYSLLSAFIHFN